MQLGDRKVSHLYTENICLELISFFSTPIYWQNLFKTFISFFLPLFTDKICLKFISFFSTHIYWQHLFQTFFFRDRNNELVKKSRRKQKEKERAAAAAIEAGEKELKKIEKELGVLKKYMAVHNALQDRNPGMFELLKKKLQERSVI